MKTREEREAIALAVLTAPCETPTAVLAHRVGLSREAVRCIRIGKLYSELLPHLPRIEPQAMQRSCLACQLFIARPSRLRGKDGSDIHLHGRCSIGIPEAANIHYARGCGAFAKG